MVGKASSNVMTASLGSGGFQVSLAFTSDAFYPNKPLLTVLGTVVQGTGNKKEAQMLSFL